VFVLNASLAANTTLVSTAYAGVALGIVHLSNRDYDIISQPLSYTMRILKIHRRDTENAEKSIQKPLRPLRLCGENENFSVRLVYYAVGASGFLMTTIMLAFAVSVLMLSFGLERIAGLSYGGIAVLRIAGASLLIAAIFPSDVTDNGLPETPIGLIHTMASYLFSPCFVAAALLLSWRFDALHKPDRPRFVLALASWLTLVVLLMVNLFQLAIGGIVQRIFVGLTWLWLLITTLCLKKTLRRS